MLRLLTTTNGHFLVIGPIWGRTLHLGYQSIENNIFTYSLALYADSQISGLSYCPWSLRLHHQRRPLLEASKTETQPILSLKTGADIAEDEHTDPSLHLSIPPVFVPDPVEVPLPNIAEPVVEEVALEEVARVAITPSESPKQLFSSRPALNPRTAKEFQVGDMITVKRYVPSYLSYFRKLQQDDRGWYVAAWDLDTEKDYVSFNQWRNEWAVLSDTSKALVHVPSETESEDDDMLEETYHGNLPPLPPRKLPVSNDLSPARHELIEHKSIAVLHGTEHDYQTMGATWKLAELSQVLIRAKDGGLFFLDLHRDEDGWYVETEDDRKVDVFFDMRRGLWAIDRLI